MKPKSLCLNPIWKQHKAVFKEDCGHTLPAYFIGVNEEIAAVKNHLGLMDVSFLECIQVTGTDRISLLHRLLTQNIEKLRPGEGAPAAFLSAQGKILSSMTVHRMDDWILLLVEAGYGASTIQQLEKFVITDDVQFKLMNESHVLLSLSGPKATDFIQKISQNLGLPEHPFHLTQIKINHQTVSLIYQKRLGHAGYDLLIPRANAEEIAKRIVIAGQNESLKLIGYEAMEILRIEAGVLRYGFDMDETLFLNETGLENDLVDHAKGCYPGQEVVAKMITYRKVHRKITGLKWGNPILPKKGEKVALNDTEVGFVTSSCYSSHLQARIGFGLLKREVAEVGQKVVILAEGGPFSAEVCKMPFHF